MDDTRTLVDSGEYDAESLNAILDHATKEVLLATGNECWKYKGEVCAKNCEWICKNSR